MPRHFSSGLDFELISGLARIGLEQPGSDLRQLTAHLHSVLQHLAAIVSPTALLHAALGHIEPLAVGSIARHDMKSPFTLLLSLSPTFLSHFLPLTITQNLHNHQPHC